ncbi:MAG: hypothetical protein ACREQV_24865, partial [Candidatus Binatia bacterium]
MNPRNYRKSPLSPPFDYAQDMLFQRGEHLFYSPNPPLKKEEQGGFVCRGRNDPSQLRLIVLVFFFIWMLLAAGIGDAHPLGNFSIN